jgi:hypothetical protein
MFPFPCETRGGGDKKVDTTVFMIIFSFFDPTIEKEGERGRELSILFLRERERWHELPWIFLQPYDLITQQQSS